MRGVLTAGSEEERTARRDISFLRHERQRKYIATWKTGDIVHEGAERSFLGGGAE